MMICIKNGNLSKQSLHVEQGSSGVACNVMKGPLKPYQLPGFQRITTQ